MPVDVITRISLRMGTNDVKLLSRFAVRLGHKLQCLFTPCFEIGLEMIEYNFVSGDLYAAYVVRHVSVIIFRLEVRFHVIYATTLTQSPKFVC